MQDRLNRLISSSAFQNSIILVIVIAGVLVGLGTFPSVTSRFGTAINILDGLVLAIFTIEIVLKMVALWPKPQKFFLDGWNVFDFLIVAVCFLPFGGSSMSRCCDSSGSCGFSGLLP